MIFNHDFISMRTRFPRHAFQHKGGNPGTPTTYAPPAPPTAANAAAVQASIDQKQKMLQKQGVTSTLLKGQQSPTGQSGTLLGSAGGAFSVGTGAQKNTLLGGG